MPEAPDLEVIKEVLARRVKGLAVEQGAGAQTPGVARSDLNRFF